MDEHDLPFNLAKSFSYITLVLILISSFILTLFIGRTMMSMVLESQEEYALLLADNINRQIFRKFTLPVTYTSGHVALADPAQYKLLDDVIQSQLHGLQLDAVRMYDDHYTVLYSTDAKDVRRTDLYTAGIPLVFEGKPHHFDIISTISYAEALITPQLKKGTFVLRTVFPLTIDSDIKSLRVHGDSTAVLGVLEIMQDLTSSYQGTIRAQRMMIAGFLVSALVLFFLIHLVAHRAEETLSRRMARNLQLTAQLQQAEKLASMGRMVASIAHEIRNPLGIIRSSAEFLIRRHKSEDAVQQSMLTAIYDESCRLGTTVNDFLDYARPRTPHKEDVHIPNLINKAIAFLEGELHRQNVTVHCSLSPSLSIQGDSDLFYRAFYNILSNAMQAINGQGDIYVYNELAANGHTIITFRDTGPGFSPESMKKATEPFFTTKDSGTGLGLPIVQAIITSHNGKLSLANAPEGGALVTLDFPPASSTEQGTPHE